jgi:hypothetical protein
MKAFHSGREAKEFLISRIVAEAQCENILLSEVERKMLYFSESNWTLPDMTAVYEDFDREHDQNQYEKKIAGLIRRTDKHVRKESRNEYDTWWAAIRFLKREDHYIFGDDRDCRSATRRRSIETLRSRTCCRDLFPTGNLSLC